MREYLLFIDTETSGIPKDWEKPYSAEGNWPYVVQIAWIICTPDGKEVKSENYFIGDRDFTITSASQKIHGITREFLNIHGESRLSVMRKLGQDLQTYQPLVVGHFVQLDFHMAGVCFYRAGLANPLPELPTFCTMLASSPYVYLSKRKYLGLGELYKRLFGTLLTQQHNAIVDARATAKCFFEMLKRGDIHEQMILQHQIPSGKAVATKSVPVYWMALVLVSLITLILYLL